MSYLKKLKFFLLFSILLTNSVFSAEKILHIDINFLMNNSLAGKSIKLQIEKINNSNTKNFKKLQTNLKNEESKLISQKDILNESDYLVKLNEFKKKINEFNIKKNEAVKDLQKKKIESQKKLIDNLISILTEYSTKNSVDYILRKENVLIGKSALDITADILKALDAKIKNIKL